MRAIRVPSLIPLFLVLFLSCLSFVPSVQAASSGTKVLYEGGFSVQDLEWGLNPEGGALPILPDTRYLADPGLVDLPVTELLLLIPLDSKVRSVYVEPLEVHSEVVPGDLAIAGPKRTDSGESIVADPAKSSFPAPVTTWGEYAGTHTWRGYRLLSVRVSPLRVAVEGDVTRLEFLDRYAIRVDLESGADISDLAIRRRQIPGEARQAQVVLDQLVANSDVVSTYIRDDGHTVAEPIKGFQPTSAPSLVGSSVAFLIITNEDMASEFQRLADFKTSMGMPTVVVTTEFIQANSRHGSDLQDTIRLFTKDAYEMWGTEYLLLGGDTDIIPARYVNNSYFPTLGSTMIPVDLYFAGLDGNWNDNGNSSYGEPYGTLDGDDLVDFAEEVYLGRATVSTSTAARSFVNKVIAYESTGPDGEWANRALFAAEVLFPDDYPIDPVIDMDGALFSHGIIEDSLIPCTDMEYTRMYETDEGYPMDAQLTLAALIDTLNTGHYGIFNQIGHGFYFNMSVGNGNFMTSDADALVNGDHLFLMYSLNCASAAFDYSCLMERFVQNPNGGSIASIGASRAAFPTTSNDYQQEFFNQLLCQNERRVGRLLALSRLPFLAATYENRADRWTFENYTLLGDPTVRIWNGTPEVALVDCPSGMGLGPETVAVTVSNSQGFVSGASVCLSKDGDDFAYGTTDALGQISLDFLATSQGPVELTVSGQNLAKTQIVIPATTGDPYLALSEMVVADDGSDGSAGNGNLVIEAGEVVALWPTILETGGYGASSLSGTFSTSDPGVTILNGATTFDNVAAGGFTTGVTPLLVAFDSDLGDGTEIQFQFLVSDSVEGTYLSEWSGRVLAPEVEMTGFNWNDTVYGNGDDFVDAMERLSLSLRIKNFGAGAADFLTIRLRTMDTNVVFYGDTVTTVTNLGLVQEVELNNSLSMAISSIFRSSKCWLLVEDNHGRTVRHDFRIHRPEPPTDLQLDTSLGADVIAIRWENSVSADEYGYDVFRSQTEGGIFSRINTDVIVNTAFFVDTGLEQFTKYFYKVATLDTSLTSSDFSEAVGQSTAPSEITGFPIPFATETSGPLAVGDVDGDYGLEIVLGSDEVYVWHDDGSELMDGDGDSQTLGPFTNDSAEFGPAAIALARLDDQPGLEMIVSRRSDFTIHIYRKDGTEMPGWPQSTNGLAGADWNWAAPSVGDIDGDGEEEIVVNTLNGVTWAWNLDGSEVLDGDNNVATHGVFLLRAGAEWEWSMSGPALADLDGDGAKDIIFGTKSDSSGLKRLMALRYDGTNVPGFPYIATGKIACHPAVGDLNGDGILEIVFWDSVKIMYAVQQDGSNYPGFPYNTGIGASMAWITSPALGDMDGDGDLEIVWTANETGDLSRVAIIDTDIDGGTSGTMLPNWPVVLPGSSEGSPILGDINGDGSPDILQGIGGGSEDAPNNLYAFNADGTDVPGFPITLGGPLMPSVTICDFDYDGDADIVYGGWDMQIHVWDMPYPFEMANTPWPTFHGSYKRDGVLLLEQVGVEEDVDLPPSSFQVGSPFPNPFNPITKVRLYVPDANGGMGALDLSVFDLKGRRVKLLRSGAIEAGWHTITWDGTDDSGRTQASGVYFMQASSGTNARIHKMTLIK
ncbi:MAG: VCBS repeat-containing protein [Gemmatimonadales bacterium]|nr:VCBS repeat-containing protein [Gemmatimonadales bacterium]